MNLYSASLHVSLCFTAFVGVKNLQNRPLLFTIVVAYLRGSTSIFFFLFRQFIEQEKGMAVNSSANELAKVHSHLGLTLASVS